MTTPDELSARAGPANEDAPRANEGSAGVDRLERLEQQLAAVGELPIAGRVEVFAAVNEALVAELTSMEETDRSRATDVRAPDLRVLRPGRTGEGSRHEGPPAT